MYFICSCYAHVHIHTIFASHRYIKGLFEAADKNNDGTLDFSEIIKLMKQLNVGLSKRVLKKKFKVLCVCLCVCACVHACVCLSVSICVYMCLFLYVCMCAYMHITRDPNNLSIHS